MSSLIFWKKKIRKNISKCHLLNFLPRVLSIQNSPAYKKKAISRRLNLGVVHAVRRSKTQLATEISVLITDIIVKVILFDARSLISYINTGKRSLYWRMLSILYTFLTVPLSSKIVPSGCVKISADDILKYLSYFLQKIEFYISCKLSQFMSKSLFSSKKIRKI